MGLCKSTLGLNLLVQLDGREEVLFASINILRKICVAMKNHGQAERELQSKRQESVLKVNILLDVKKAQKDIFRTLLDFSESLFFHRSDVIGTTCPYSLAWMIQDEKRQLPSLRLLS